MRLQDAGFGITSTIRFREKAWFPQGHAQTITGRCLNIAKAWLPSPDSDRDLTWACDCLYMYMFVYMYISHTHRATDGSLGMMKTSKDDTRVARLIPYTPA